MQIRASNTPCGIVHSELGSEVYLPLERAEIHVDIVDVSALVTFSQQFWQYSPSGLTRAKYVFPVPARAAVCGFEMIAEDGTVITAIVKEKEQARREHQEAIRQGQMTGLVEHVTDDIFSLSLGALPGKQTITTRITYVLDLMDDDVSDQVRLQLPMYIGSRYGTIPVGMLGARTVPPNRISISVDVRMQGAVKSVNSPTHPSVLISPGPSQQIPAAARYTSGDFMTQDFVLVVTAEGLDAPRCFAQRAPNGTIAMQLSIVPKFNLPSVPRQEYIFLVDRSGSMGGQRIETAKRALVMLLRALPSQNTWFNIVSFGSGSDSLWPQSVSYGEQSMLQATSYVDRMSANYGGTEMRSALENVFRSRRTDVPSAVFVLTDGEAFDIDNTIMPVEQAVKQAATNAPVRVFTLGIGETTSSALCEGMARVGNGVCLMATTAETIIGKCSRLVRASRTYILKNVTVDWGVRTDLAAAHRTGNNEVRGVRQAPAEVAAMYPGNRFVVFALVEDATFVPPREVVIRAQRDGHGEIFQFSIPVQVVEFPPEHHPQPLIQTLAARRAIMDIEDSGRGFHSPDAKSLIIRLGTQYQLASKYTSFIAVDKRTRSEVSRDVEERIQLSPVNPPAFAPRGFAMSASRSRIGALAGRGGFRATTNAHSAFGSAAAIGSISPPATFGGTSFGAAMSAQPNDLFGSTVRIGSIYPPALPASGMLLRFDELSSGHSTRKANTFGQAPAAPAAFSHSMTFHSHTSMQGSPDLGRDRDRERERVGMLSPMFTSAGGFVPSNMETPKPEPELNVSALSKEDKVFQLIRLQAFDGSFPASQLLLALLGKNAPFAPIPAAGVSEKTWATALAVAWLREHMADQPELLDGIVDKAVEFINQTPGLDADALLARASAVLAST